MIRAMYHSTSSQVCVHHAVTAGQCGNAFAENIFAYIFLYFTPALCFILVYNCGLTVRNERLCYVMLCIRGSLFALS